MTTYIPGAIRLQHLAQILESLVLARPDLSEAIGLVAVACGLAGEAGPPIITITTSEKLEAKHDRAID